jgi:4-diphosphocytidyl-2-C-methyl-D-erythritol kinase
LKKTKSFAKLNFYLDVIGRYNNGYHKIRSLFSEVSLFDEINYFQNNEGKIRIYDEIKILPENNLLKKASDKLIEIKNRTVFGIDFHIKKNIPIGGGMGGGSSNAAFVLKTLNALWNLGYSYEKLEKIGAQLGADVPFFIRGGIQKVGGIGQILSPIIAKPVNLEIILVIPEISISTELAYKKIDEKKLAIDSFNFKKKFDLLVKGFKDCNYELIVENVYNKFEEVIFPEFPKLEMIKEQIMSSGADAALMSGSGSTIFGIYENESKKKSGAEILKKLGNRIISDIKIL